MADAQNQQPVAPDVQEPESEDQKAQRLAIVEAFAAQVKEKRKTAIEGRRQSGIEDIWAEDEEHYEGVDDANRAGTKMVKGRSLTDSPTEATADKGVTRSTVFLKITRPYVDAAAARVSDMLLPTDDRNFALRHTPMPELTAMLEDTRAIGADGQPKPAAPAAAQPPQPVAGGIRALPGKIAGMFGMGQGVPPAVPATQPKTVADQANDVIARAKKSAERAQQEIDDWLTEARYHAEVRTVIEASARVGTGVLKGPVPSLTRNRAAKKQEDGSWTVEIREQIKPQSRFISHWNFFPDPNCGTNVQKGSFTFECDDITTRALSELKRDPTYLPEMIEQVLDEGPCNPVDGTRKLKEGEKPSDKDLYQIWYFHGLVSKKEMEAAGCTCSDKELYPAMVTMVNDRVIKVTLSPLDSGEFPYDVMVWQARTDHWAGVGVGRQMRECQKGANAAVRNLMDNAGLSAGPQIVIDRKKLVPANGRWELTPRKIWYSADDEEIEDVRKSFWIVNIDTRQAELLSILQFWLREAEEVTGLPMLLQGQMGAAGQTDKVGIANIMNNNGSTVLRRIARNFDDRITEPHIGRYYEWLLLYGPGPAKGDFVIDARGSSALVERDLQSQQLVQIVGLSLNPAYGLDPEQVMREFLKSLRFDPKALELTQERKEELASRPPPEAPQVTAAKIMAQAASERNSDTLVSKAQLEKMRLDHEASVALQERNLKEALAGIEFRMGMADISSGERQHLETMKVRLADTTLRLRTQTDLAVGSHAVDVHKHRNPSPQVIAPGAEPAERAAPGHAFTQ